MPARDGAGCATLIPDPAPSRGAAAPVFSEFRPIATNDSPANRSQNRRIEIVLTPADYEPPVVEAR